CFFFQAEDGIRDFHVTGVQTCALPIYGRALDSLVDWRLSPDVEFCAYAIPHPSEPKMNVRIQTFGKGYEWGYPETEIATNICSRSEEHTSELHSRENLVCRLLLEKNKK